MSLLLLYCRFKTSYTDIELGFFCLKEGKMPKVGKMGVGEQGLSSRSLMCEGLKKREIWCGRSWYLY